MLWAGLRESVVVVFVGLHALASRLLIRSLASPAPPDSRFGNLPH